LLSKNGFLLDYSFFHKKNTETHVLLINVNDKINLDELVLDLDIKDSFIKYCTKSTHCIIYQRSEKAGTEIHLAAKDIFIPAIVYIDGREFYQIHEYYNWNEYVDLQKNHPGFNGYEREGAGDWISINLGFPGKSIVTKEFIKGSKVIHSMREFMIPNISFSFKILDMLLEKYLGDDVLIPYKISDRMAKFPKAFSELKVFMEKYIK
jgi:hypothetical protein